MSNMIDLISMAIKDQRPLVLLFGQDAWANASGTDAVLDSASRRLGRGADDTRGWRSILDGIQLTENFYAWLSERFERRVPPRSLEILGDIPWSAVFTSSLDATLIKLFSGNGCEPEPILTNNEFPRAVRSRSRPPMYYLFSRAGVVDSMARPPSNASELNARRIQHTVQLLNRLLQTATAVGYIIVEGFKPDKDWLRVDD